MTGNLYVCSSPHLRDNSSTQRIMLDVIIALIPALVAGVVFFGMRAVWVLLVTLISSVLSEYLMRKAMKREQTISDFSAALTGLLLGMNMPSTVPLWIAAVGGVVAIVIVKQLFGGIGQNFMNPALGARVIITVSYTKYMTGWVAPGWGADAVSAATPLGALKGGSGQLFSYAELFWGNIGGCIGETSAFALLLGGIYLVIRKVISYEIPVIYIGTVAVLSFVIGPKGIFTGDPLFHVLAGGLLLGAIYMATDYVTTPITKKGKIIFALGCGILTTVLRLFSNMPEGVSFSIILMNIVTPLIDRYTVPASFGGGKNVG